jgi:hypothetical protein
MTCIVATMEQSAALPAHPERSSQDPLRISWSTGQFVAWLVLLVSASAVGVFLSIVTIPPGEELFASPALYLSLFVLTVPCWLAGWYVPQAAPYWGLAIAPAYLGALGWSMNAHPAIGADLSVFGIPLMLVLLAIPAMTAVAARFSRKTLAK